MEGQTTAVPEIDKKAVDTTNISEFNLPDVFADEVLGQMDPKVLVDTMLIESVDGHIQTMKGPFTPNMAKAKVDEFKELTRSRIKEIEFTFMR